MSDLQTVLQFITTFEQKYADQSTYEIANRLRGHTKPTYTTQTWTIATGFEQPFIDGALNQTIVLAGEPTDFGHFIASFSDQLDKPGFQWSDLTRWTGDHTSWAGDIGSAIAIYRSDPSKFKSLHDAFDRFASDSDYSADIAAFCVGAIVASSPKIPIAQAINFYNSRPYHEHIQTFLKTRFNAILTSDKLTNPAKVEADIRSSVFAYLELSPDSGILRRVKKFFNQRLKLEPEDAREYLSADLLQGSLHFMTHLIQKGNLAPLKFKPYLLPQAPWLGTVNYDVSAG